uniref:Aminomethyltransferase n=1 Tax=Hanusia phi TaxID=3032 RepID=A0A7S0HWT1_9CRYP
MIRSSMLVGRSKMLGFASNTFKAVRTVGIRFASTSNLKKTLVYDEHIKLGGQMVDFAEYAMPVQYKEHEKADSIINSVKHVRNKAGLFDVSHMCSIRWRGKDAVAFVESVTVADIENLPMGKGTLSIIPNEKGGIIDDTMITKTTDKKGDHIYQVINAGCAPKDLKFFEEKLGKFGGDVSMEVQWDNRGLYALQGPEAVKVMQRLIPVYDFKYMNFGDAENLVLDGMEIFVSRCGYTGEDGFEIFVPEENAVKLWRKLIEQPEVHPAGLGARDTLRLEAGLCLYGHDIDDTTTPTMAGLSWTVGKGRREPGARPFTGSDVILKQVAEGPKSVSKMRVGIVSKGAPAREGAEISLPSGEVIGKVTSGAVSPIMMQNIAMGYVNRPHNKTGTEVVVTVRGKSNPGTVVKMPFVPTKYYKAP